MFKKSFALIFGALLLAGTTQAQTHYYSFTVQSSGQNALLRHAYRIMTG